MSWYRRNQPATFEMVGMGVCGGTTGFLVTCLVVKIVDRFGDLRGVWVPGNVLVLFYGLSTALTPSSLPHLAFLFFPMFGGPSTALAGFMPDLLAKLMPPDVQGTFQTSKDFVYHLQKAVLVWPWLGLYVKSESLPEPFDALAIWVAMAIFTLWLTLRQLPKDPRTGIEQGMALEPFWSTEYARGRWYEKHSGRKSSQAEQEKAAAAIDAVMVDLGGDQPAAPQGQAVIAEGATKLGLMLSDLEHTTLPHNQLPTRKLAYGADGERGGSTNINEGEGSKEEKSSCGDFGDIFTPVAKLPSAQLLH
eukprot:CAMPEP_0115528198 /NCGR_PEP_ID=MMETSP0271-20121206/83265_1 /TAXON_ID=71861 /ORGANISM="Scrippsiella trochoidea, Strain CCMP3099" /LENGTH=304 /DNA_ID=CAMNT_0002960107 /DNA_START=171 /DNA_END=1083 /DNA_ORIENTATION=-